MLPYRVQEVKTGLYIYVYSGGATPSVSGDHHVTLHCARGSPSYRFYFDHISFSPFFSAFFARCVADGVRLQFGSAVQRPLRSPDDVPRRTTVVHGDSLPHVGDAFYEVVLQAAEEVERIAGGHYVPNLYECVFNMVCVYPWGEEDLLQEVAEAQCEGSRSPSGTPGAPMKSFWERCAFLPLQTVSQHRFFKKALESLRTGTCGEKRDSIAACVRQVRLAVYTQASRSPSRERILCGEHLFSLVPSISEVVAGFGTSLGTLREMLMCASQGNLLDNRLLSVLLPDVSVDCLTILTCISSQGEYASRACIDACCFGCSSERWRCLDMPSKSSRMRSGAASRDGAATSTGARNAVLPLRQAVSTSALSQHRTDEQLISEAHDARGASWTTSQPQKPIATKSHTPFPDSLLWSNSGASSQLDRSVDRLGAVRQLSKSPGGGPSLLKDGIASSPPTAEMRCTAPAPPVALGTDAVKATVETPVTPSDKGTPNESCSHGWSTVKGECGSLKAVGGLAEGAKTAPLEQNAAGQEREAQIRQSYQSGPDTAAMPPAYNNTLQTSRAGLEGREQPLHALESQRMHRAAELPHTAPAFDGAEVCVENMCKSERGVPSTNIETLDSYVAYFDAAFLLYTNTVNAKILMNDVNRFSNENINLVPLPEAAAQRWERGDQQVDAIRRQETAPIRQQRLMGLKPTALQSETRQQLGERRDAMNSTVAKIQQAPAEAGVKALEGYEESLEVVRRVPDDCNSVVRQLEDVLLRAVETANNVGPKEPHRETVRAELSIPEMAFAELHAAVDAAREAGEAEAAARVGAPAASVLKQRTIKAALDSLRTDLAAATAEYASVCTALEKSRTELHSMEGAIAGKQEELALLCAEVDAAAGDLDAIRAAKNTTREMLRCTTEELETQRVAAVHGRQGSSCGCCGSLNDTSIATAKVVAEEMRKVVEELIEAVEWIEEVEDTMVNESDRAVMTLRRCDGEMTLRIDRLMDRCACFMEVESRLAMRSALIPSEGSSRNFSRPYPNHKK
ncbi:hypothetical protein JKF63_04007 [Porcisia hertigi]|uniref:Uncharacterized protein n=1 Tax=Porcisia hertigi TaxID=2761500 RepID=A0A836IHH0_9TRYP|nr:hypothetical protein JKF63_04007 [Porcisia hertigi]